MKFKTVLSALCMMAVFACTEEMAPLAPEVPEVTTPENLVEMTITASQDATKSTFDGKTIGWEMTDVVAIYDGVAKREFKVSEIDEQTGTATLTGLVDKDATAFQAVYPYSAAGNDLPVEGKINITVPAVQTLTESAVVAPGALVCVGEVVEGKISFKNAVSLLKVKVTEEMTSVTVKGEKYENIAGAATATTAAVTSEGGAANVVLKPVGETFAAGDYYIALLPTTFEDGFTVAYRKASGLAVLKSGAEVEFKANGGFDVTGKDLTTLTWLTNPLMSASDLKTYLANQDNYAGEAVSLGQNIDLMEEAWTPVALTGNLDGAGYTICGLKVEAADDYGSMFTTIDTDASLKNVTVEGAISLSTSATTSYAGLVGELKGTMYKVINKASVTAASTGSSRCYQGGLVGLVNSGSIVECENHGAITLSSTTTVVSFVGGLVGVMSPAGLVQNSKNYGTVTSESAKMEGIGGIVGIQQGGDVDKCTNEGTLVPTAAAVNSYAGGITGFVQNQSSGKLVISGCVNKGEIQTVATLKAAGGIVGVIHRYCTASSEINGCTNNAALTASITKNEFYMGGIVGRMADPGTGTPGAHVNYIKNCISYGDISVTKDNSVQSSALGVGGILGKSLGIVELTNNKTLASSVTVSDGYAGNRSTIVGGIVGNTDDSGSLTVSSNVNKAAVSCASTRGNNYVMLSGGIIGRCIGTLDSSNNINFGDVLVSNANIGTGKNPFTGGIVGEFNLTSDEKATLSGDKTFGNISSDCGRAGLICGVINGTTTLTLSDCVVGGILNDPTNVYTSLGITKDNFDDKNNMLVSYTSKTSTWSQIGTIFGEAANYDK